MCKNIFKIVIMILLLTVSNNIASQYLAKERDSLKNELNSAKHDTTRIQLYLSMGELYEYQGPGDSALVFYEMALKLADKGIIASKKDKKAQYFYLQLKAKTYAGTSYFYLVNSEKEKSLEYYDKSLEINKDIGNEKGIAELYSKTGKRYLEMGERGKGLDYSFLALDILEKTGNKKQLVDVYYSIGWTFLFQDILEKSLEYFIKSYGIAEEIQNKRMIALTTSFISYLYSTQGKYDSAIVYNKRSYCASKEIGHDAWVADCMSSYGNIYGNMGELDSALYYYLKHLEYYEEKGSSGNPVLFGNLSTLYYEMTLREETNSAKWNLYLQKSIDYGTMAKKLSNKRFDNQSRLLSAECLMQSYKLKGDTKKALEYTELVMELRDSIYNTSKTEEILNMEYQYKEEKKELEMDNLRKTNELIEAKRQKQIVFIISLIVIIIAVVAFLFYIFRSLKQKRKANKILTQQKEEIQDSITYAQRIQNAILPSIEILNENFSDNFILYRPKDIVSGDFYWMRQVKNFVVIAVADCTGHGVPGAFMSMLGISILNEIVSKSRFDNPSDILERLRKKVKSSLRQRGGQSEQKDGMDIALFVIDTETYELQYSGAFNPLYIFKQGQLVVLKGDRQPVAVYPKEKDFTNHSYQLKNGDVLYAFSDGFADQIGGEKEKKFMIKKFKELLGGIHTMPMEKQCGILAKTLDDWMKDTEQMDDILVLGIRI